MRHALVELRPQSMSHCCAKSTDGQAPFIVVAMASSISTALPEFANIPNNGLVLVHYVSNN